MLLVIADAHVSELSGSQEEFFGMLSAISKTSNDVLFLGDIMDLWVAIPRYEDSLQRRFVLWCRQEKQRRRLYFVEGNHEFFVASKYSDAFTETNEHEISLGGVLFIHGNDIQGARFGFNRLFISFCKSWLARGLLWMMPYGQRVVCLAKRLTSSKPGTKALLPVCAIRQWARSLPRNYASILLGHFHVKGTLLLPAKTKCLALPAWKNTRQIAFVNGRNCVCKHWRTLL